MALDIDGTLIDETETLSPGVRTAIDSVVAAGVPVILTTGKSAWAAHLTIGRLELPRSYCIASNGAVTTQYPPMRIIDAITFDARPAVEAALRTMRRGRVAVEVVGEGYRVSERLPANLATTLAGKIWVEPMDRLLAAPVTRAMIYDPDSPVPSMLQEFGPADVDKAVALARLTDRLGIRRERVLAIGDGPNDAVMLAWAGRGVAMGNAEREVVLAADDVTGSLADDGVLTELARWFPLPAGSGTGGPGSATAGSRYAQVLAATSEATRVSPPEARAGARYHRVPVGDRRFFVKQFSYATDWISRITGDREYWILAAWRAGLLLRASAYVDHAVIDMGLTGDELNIVMNDVGDHLVPDGHTPISDATHGAFVATLAALSALFWDWHDDVGLMRIEQRFAMLSPESIRPELAADRVPGPVAAAERGWADLVRRAPELSRVTRAVHADPGALAAALQGTPHTFAQGDWKMGNLGLHPDGTVILLDWAYPGQAPVCWDLWWYLALNRERLPESKEASLARYRRELTANAVTTDDWWDEQNDLCAIGVMATFGWEKALGDDAELDWWQSRVLAASRRLGS